MRYSYGANGCVRRTPNTWDRCLKDAHDIYSHDVNPSWTNGFVRLPEKGMFFGNKTFWRARLLRHPQGIIGECVCVCARPCRNQKHSYEIKHTFWKTIDGQRILWDSHGEKGWVRKIWKTFGTALSDEHGYICGPNSLADASPLRHRWEIGVRVILWELWTRSFW